MQPCCSWKETIGPPQPPPPLPPSSSSSLRFTYGLWVTPEVSVGYLPRLKVLQEQVYPRGLCVPPRKTDLDGLITVKTPDNKMTSGRQQTRMCRRSSAESSSWEGLLFSLSHTLFLSLSILFTRLYRRESREWSEDNLALKKGGQNKKQGRNKTCVHSIE